MNNNNKQIPDFFFQVTSTTERIKQQPKQQLLIWASDFFTVFGMSVIGAFSGYLIFLIKKKYNIDLIPIITSFRQRSRNREMTSTNCQNNTSPSNLYFLLCFVYIKKNIHFIFILCLRHLMLSKICNFN